MLPGLDSERCSECPKQDSEEVQNRTRWESSSYYMKHWVSIATMVERKRCVASPMPQS